MARLDPLIRYRQHLVDEKRRVLSELLRQAEAFAAAKNQILMQVAREQILADEASDMQTRADFGRYAEAQKHRMAAIDAQVAKLNVRIAMAQEEVREAFSDMKKVDITERERKKRARKTADAKESADLDDIGIEGYRRKKTEAEKETSMIEEEDAE